MKSIGNINNFTDIEPNTLYETSYNHIYRYERHMIHKNKSDDGNYNNLVFHDIDGGRLTQYKSKLTTILDYEENKALRFGFSEETVDDEENPYYLDYLSESDNFEDYYLTFQGFILNSRLQYKADYGINPINVKYLPTILNREYTMTPTNDDWKNWTSSIRITSDAGTSKYDNWLPITPLRNYIPNPNGDNINFIKFPLDPNNRFYQLSPNRYQYDINGNLAESETEFIWYITLIYTLLQYGNMCPGYYIQSLINSEIMIKPFVISFVDRMYYSFKNGWTNAAANFDNKFMDPKTSRLNQDTIEAYQNTSIALMAGQTKYIKGLWKDWYEHSSSSDYTLIIAPSQLYKKANNKYFRFYFSLVVSNGDVYRIYAHWKKQTENTSAFSIQTATYFGGITPSYLHHFNIEFVQVISISENTYNTHLKNGEVFIIDDTPHTSEEASLYLFKLHFNIKEEIKKWFQADSGSNNYNNKTKAAAEGWNLHFVYNMPIISFGNPVRNLTDNTIQSSFDDINSLNDFYKQELSNNNINNYHYNYTKYGLDYDSIRLLRSGGMDIPDIIFNVDGGIMKGYYDKYINLYIPKYFSILHLDSYLKITNTNPNYTRLVLYLSKQISWNNNQLSYINPTINSEAIEIISDNKTKFNKHLQNMKSLLYFHINNYKRSDIYTDKNNEDLTFLKNNDYVSKLDIQNFIYHNWSSDSTDSTNEFDINIACHSIILADNNNNFYGTIDYFVNVTYKNHYMFVFKHITQKIFSSIKNSLIHSSSSDSLIKYVDMYKIKSLFPNLTIWKSSGDDNVNIFNSITNNLTFEDIIIYFLEDDIELVYEIDITIENIETNLGVTLVNDKITETFDIFSIEYYKYIYDDDSEAIYKISQIYDQNISNMLIYYDSNKQQLHVNDFDQDILKIFGLHINNTNIVNFVDNNMNSSIFFHIHFNRIQNLETIDQLNDDNNYLDGSDNKIRTYFFNFKDMMSSFMELQSYMKPIYTMMGTISQFLKRKTKDTGAIDTYIEFPILHKFQFTNFMYREVVYKSNDPYLHLTFHMSPESLYEIAGTRGYQSLIAISEDDTDIYIHTCKVLKRLKVIFSSYNVITTHTHNNPPHTRNLLEYIIAIIDINDNYPNLEQIDIHDNTDTLYTINTPYYYTSYKKLLFRLVNLKGINTINCVDPTSYHYFFDEEIKKSNFDIVCMTTYQAIYQEYAREQLCILKENSISDNIALGSNHIYYFETSSTQDMNLDNFFDNIVIKKFDDNDQTNLTIYYPGKNMDAYNKFKLLLYYIFLKRENKSDEAIEDLLGTSIPKTLILGANSLEDFLNIKTTCNIVQKLDYTTY